MTHYNIDNYGHTLTVKKAVHGYEVQFYEDKRPLGPSEIWNNLEDIIEEYDIIIQAKEDIIA